MTFIKTQRLTPHQAHELTKMGFILTLVRFFYGEFDEYQIYVD
jgi:hypothetical protein